MGGGRWQVAGGRWQLESKKDTSCLWHVRNEQCKGRRKGADRHANTFAKVPTTTDDDNKYNNYNNYSNSKNNNNNKITSSTFASSSSALSSA